VVTDLLRLAHVGLIIDYWPERFALRIDEGAFVTRSSGTRDAVLARNRAPEVFGDGRLARVGHTSLSRLLKTGAGFRSR
jgi:hypothetical protein